MKVHNNGVKFFLKEHSNSYAHHMFLRKNFAHFLSYQIVFTKQKQNLKNVNAPSEVISTHFV